MITSTVGTKGQVVIPAKIRKKYNIKNGTKINFVDEKGDIKFIPITPEFIEENFGFLGTKGNLLKALMEEKKIEREL